MTALRGVRVVIRQPSIRDLMTAIIKTMGPVATLFLLGEAEISNSDACC